MHLLRSLQLLAIALCFLLSSNTSAIEVTIEVRGVSAEVIPGMVVYLEPLEQQDLTHIEVAPLVIYQSDMKFSPYISVIKNGVGLTFSNKDDITHHIYSVASKNKFSFKIKSGDNTSIEPVAVSGKILMACNIHDWMSGYLLVVDTPLYSVTNRYGETTFNVPISGRYKLVVWHPQIEETEQNLSREIMVNKKQHYKITLTKKLEDLPPQENPDGLDFLDGY